MLGKVVTLYIDDTSIRLLVIKGRRVKKWADLPLDPGLVDGGVVVNEPELANRIKQLFRDQKIKSRNVIIGVSGLHCFTRPVFLPQLSKAVMPEAVTRVAESVLPLSLDQLYLSWQTIGSAPAGKTQVFVTALRRKSADSIMRTVSQAGLKPHILDVKPLALTRLVPEPTAVIVDVQHSEFDIIIMVKGIPQPIRTIPFPRESLSWEDRFPLIRDDLDRTIKFYNTNNPESSLPALVPTYVAGELVYRPELCQALSRELGYPISMLSSPLGDEPVDLRRHLINIGLALKAPSLRKVSGPSLATLNLLPSPYRPKPLPLVKMAAIPAAVIIATLIVPMVLSIQDTSASQELTKSQLESTNKTIAQRQAQKQELNNDIAGLEKNVAIAQASLSAFTFALDSLEAKHDNLDGDFGLIHSAVPTGITLNSISYTDNKLLVKGTSDTDRLVLTYARILNDSGRYSEVVISTVQNGETSTDFMLTLKRS